MKKTGRKNKVYSAEFKIGVIMDMREHHLSYGETVRKYLQGVSPTSAIGTIQRWERIYLEEGAEGLMKERRGRGSKGRYGYRRITQVLKEKGYTINHKTVQKLMKGLGLKGKQRKNDKYHSYKGEVGKIADDLLKRDFYAEKPFEKLTTDVTQFKVYN